MPERRNTTSLENAFFKRPKPNFTDSAESENASIYNEYMTRLREKEKKSPSRTLTTTTSMKESTQRRDIRTSPGHVIHKSTQRETEHLKTRRAAVAKSASAASVIPPGCDPEPRSRNAYRIKYAGHCECAMNDALIKIRKDLGLEEFGYVPGNNDVIMKEFPNHPNIDRFKKLSVGKLNMLRDSKWFKTNIGNNTINRTTLKKIADLLCRWPRPSELVHLFKDHSISIVRKAIRLSAVNEKIMNNRMSAFIGEGGHYVASFCEENGLIYLWHKRPTPVYSGGRFRRVPRSKFATVEYYYIPNMRSTQDFEAKIEKELCESMGVTKENDVAWEEIMLRDIPKLLVDVPSNVKSVSL